MEVFNIQTCEELMNLKNSIVKSHHQKSKILFICEKCGKESTRRLLKDENRLQCSRCLARQTTLEKYGVENASQLQIFKNKKKETALKHYGVENPMQCKEVVKTLQQNNMKKYGVKNPGELKSIQEKMKQTCFEKYGVSSFGQTKLYKEKCREAWNSKNQKELSLIEQKRKQTCTEKYGDKNYSNRKKFEKTMMEKYGTMHVNSIYKYQNESFDSSWELAVWIWAKEHGKEIKREPISFIYKIEEKEHLYFPDFEIDGKLIEIKGAHFFTKDGKMQNPFNVEENISAEAKHQCGLRNGVEFWSKKEMKFILSYVENKYGKDWLCKFKKK